MSALEPRPCACGHHWMIHKNGCTGWRHPDHMPAWARLLGRVRIVVLLRCKCSWTLEKLPSARRGAEGAPITEKEHADD